ncbi:MAG TPA: glycosyltransferase family 39 protein [Xanthobacteraceae bacterium]|jgi:4-amino-4-deoxy-L-arabinose transferase-like glycosyltransferase
MAALTGAIGPATQLADNLLSPLSDGARRERNVVLLLIIYVLLWTAYGMLAKGSQDVHIDMSEQFMLARELALGYPKHPPLTMLIVRLWFSVFPATDWAYYLLAAANAGLSLWISWRLYARFLDGDKRVLGLALLTLLPFFNFHALKFNPNTVLLPLWAATTLLFLRSFEMRRLSDAALAGCFAALAMYGKYWSVVLLLGLAVAAVADPRRADYFRSRAPWVTIVCGGLVMAPHLIWLIYNHFAPFSYALFVHGEASSASSLMGVIEYLSGSIAYALIPILIVLVSARPGRKALWDMLWPLDVHRRLAAAAFWATLLIPALVAPLGGVRLTSLWSMSAWTLLPVLLLSSPLLAIARRDAARIVAAAAAFPWLMVAAAPAIGFAVLRSGDPMDGHASLLAKSVDRLWHEAIGTPLEVFGSTETFTYGVPFYLSEHPAVVHLLERPATAEEEALITRQGAALLCPMSSVICLGAANARAAAVPGAKRKEVEVRRSYLGSEGRSERYAIFAIPPSEPVPARQ